MQMIGQQQLHLRYGVVRMKVICYKSQIKSKQRKIKKLKPRYDEYSTLFHSRAEVEGLYNTLSVFAGENDLVISKIEKKEIKQVTKSDALAKVAKGKKKKKSTFCCSNN